MRVRSPDCAAMLTSSAPTFPSRGRAMEPVEELAAARQQQRSRFGGKFIGQCVEPALQGFQ